MKSSDIRQAFLEYFSKQGHQIVPSSSLIPADDPTLLFTNAGMVQFKDTFLGIDNCSYTRAASSQRCVRAGGKHNDLENVGYTARHHTFFEMLGNFSFGDYFKREAITYAWDFLTNVLHLPAEKLWVTVYREDDEAADIWLKDVGVSAQRFSRCGEEDNFWSMGDTGPCGPCTEIFYDHGPDIAGGPPGSANADGDRYIEIWNLVFMQFNRDKHGKLHPLPKPSVDTGMGLERIAAVVQGVHNNYQTDIFVHLIQTLITMVGDANADHPSLKVVADHIRACAFLIADGVYPSNEGRGYVLRRIIRRAVRHGNKLGLESPFFYQLIAPLIAVMGDAYPLLKDNQSSIESILIQEENQFARTLDHGLRLLQEHIKALSNNILPGDVVFKLYDTYGFPVDLTADIAREHHLQIDMPGFDRCMQQQREQSQSASQFTTDYSHVDLLADLSSTFRGYAHEELSTAITAILLGGGKVEALTKGMNAAIVLEETPFYPESGGQVGDRGLLVSDNAIFRVDDTQRQGAAIVHYGHLIEGQLSVNTRLNAQVDKVRRASIRLNHTATHLLHAALKVILGAQVQQKGSLVDAERARFDFSHAQALTPAQLNQIETIVNERIRMNDSVLTELMDLENAKQSGAVALFGEKYSEQVRVLSMGDFSKELCGGTHAQRTGDLGLCKLIAEYGVANGVRRIELVTGMYATDWINQQLHILADSALKLKTVPAQVSDKIAQVLAELKHQEKELARLQSKLIVQQGQDLRAAMKKIGDIHLLIKKLDHASNADLRMMFDQLKSTLHDAVIVLYTLDASKISVIAGVSQAILGRVPTAATFVRHLCGKGGGRDDMAQGGGLIPSNLEEKLKEIETIITEYN
ncbi:MAG: alanine--tRNA ligase [Legionella sp.]